MGPNWRLCIVAALVFGLDAISAHADTITVTVEKMAFSPAEITVKAGDTVQWVNNDILAHTATVKGGWQVMIPAKKKASTELMEAGPIDYYCRFHPNMKGRVVVLTND